MPGYITTQPPQEPRRRGRLWLWITLIVVALLILGSAGYFFLSRSTPDKTLDSYCSAIQGGDFQSAYNQLAPTLQNLETERQFTNIISEGLGRITSCTHTSASVSGGQANATLNFGVDVGQSINGAVTLVQDGSSTWKINVLPSTPTLTMRTFCNALRNSDYEVAYTQLSSELRNRNTQASFSALFAGSTCSFSNVTTSGADANTVLTFVTASGQVSAPTVLNQDSNSNNDWKISSINFPR